MIVFGNAVKVILLIIILSDLDTNVFTNNNKKTLKTNNMKKIIFTLLAIYPLLFACSQTEEEITAAFNGNDTQMEEGSSFEQMLDAMSLVDFKNDFICYSPVNKQTVNPETCPLLFKHKKTPHLKAKAAFIEAYEMLKKDMIYYHDKDRFYYATEIQDLSLQMLRFHFIPDTSEWAAKETQFLLNLLFESGAVDLDVLADAYLKVENRITVAQKKQYIDHFRLVYFKEKKYIADNFELCKANYQAATGTEKKMYLYDGRYMLRSFQTLEYANRLLHFEQVQKN